MTGADERARVFLQAGQDRRLAEGHPWAFSNEIRMDAETKALPAGTLATLHRVDGKPLGIGTFTPHALIAFRLFDRDPHAHIDAAWIRRRLDAALARRRRFYHQPYYRAVHAEADDLPGLIVDRYGDVAVVQLNTAGIDRLHGEVLAAIEAALQPAAIILRNDAKARTLEGLESVVAVAKGSVTDAVPVHEGELRFFADVLAGQKTGWFFDQRDNRTRVAPLAKDSALLDVYCHSGGFAVAAARAGATEVLGIDSSESALALARRAAEANGVAARCAFQRGDAFAELARLARDGTAFRGRRRRSAGVREGAQGPRQRPPRLPQAQPAGGAAGRAGRIPVHRLVLASDRTRHVARGGHARRRRGRPRRSDHPPGRGGPRPSDPPAPAGNRLPEDPAAAARLKSPVLPA